MDIYVYKTYDQWYKDKPYEVLQGSVYILENGLIAIDTYIDNKNYRQIFSPVNNFAIVHKLEYGFVGFPKEINVYKDSTSWKKSKPEICFNGEVCEMECSDNYIVFINEDGYKHYLSLGGIYSVVYERSGL